MFALGKLMRHKREYMDLCDPDKPLEMKTIEKTVLKNFDSICLLLNKPEFKAQRQPNLLATLPRLAQIIRDIWTQAEEESKDLSGNTYWRNVLRTLADHCWDLSVLVRDHPKEIERPSTQASQQYFQLSMSLFCIQLELEAMFPGRRYAAYKIESSETAADWWKRQFGRSDLVTWHDFQFAMNKRFNIKSIAEANELKRDVNITGSDHVSIYEFDIFSRLFAPWCDQTVDLWRTIVKDHPAFVRLHFREVKNLLRGQRPYSYLFRRSTNTPAVWSIGYINETGIVTQILVKQEKTIVEALTECTERGLLLFPAGKDACFAPSLDAFQQGSPEGTQGEKVKGCKPKKLNRKQQPEEIYVVAPELQCSLCSQRSDEVTSMESCVHVLCDNCFDRHVQPKLYEACGERSSAGGLKLFCPVCQSVNAEAAALREVDLICLDDDGRISETLKAEKAVDLASQKNHLAEFDPLHKPETPAQANNAASEQQNEIEELYDKPIKPAKKRALVVPKLQLNEAANEYSLLANSSSQVVTEASEAVPCGKPQSCYLFYGSEEAVRHLLRQVPGLKCVQLGKGPQHDGSSSDEHLYSSIWGGKSD